MRILFSFLILFVFLGEVTLNSSTAFVRSNADSYQSDSGFGGEEQGPAEPGHAKATVKVVETASHAAEPCTPDTTFVLRPTEPKVLFAEVVVPSLNPPFARIDRPPIA